MLDAVIPVVALIGLIALSVYLFGLDSTNGALQVGLFTAMSIAGLIAHKTATHTPRSGTRSSAASRRRWAPFSSCSRSAP